MATAINKTIESFLDEVRKEYISDQHDKGIRASGHSADSLRIEVDINGGKIYGSDYFKYQSTGRAPGRFPPIESILDWIRVKRIESDIPERSLAYLIARKIASQGTDIYQGKRPGLSIEDRLTDLREKFAKNLLRGTKEQVVERIKTAFRQAFRQ